MSYEKCECYMPGELTNQNYCNAENCIYKTKKSIKIILDGRKVGILDDCSKDGNVKGPVLDDVVEETTA